MPNFSALLNQTECTIHVFPTHHRRETTQYEPTNEHVFNSATEWNTIPNDLKKNPTWANNDSTTECNTNPNVFKTVQPNLSRAHQITNVNSANWMHALLCTQLFFHRKIKCSSRSPLFTYVKSKLKLTLPILESPNSFIRAASPNMLRHYGCLRTLCPRDQASRSLSKWAPPSSTNFLICSAKSTRPSQMDLINNMIVVENNDRQIKLWSSLPTWDPCFFTNYFRGFLLVPLVAT